MKNIGIHIGATNIKTVIFKAESNTLERNEMPTATDTGSSEAGILKKKIIALSESISQDHANGESKDLCHFRPRCSR